MFYEDWTSTCALARVKGNSEGLLPECSISVKEVRSEDDSSQAETRMVTSA